MHTKVETSIERFAATQKASNLGTESYVQNSFGLNIEKYETKVKDKLDEFKNYTHEDMLLMGPRDSLVII
jgi:hypothetical protein|tara:strand:+ start:356 stop:565 length:210 start_codon:yes stop_codon:yes gene_type:complete